MATFKIYKAVPVEIYNQLFSKKDDVIDKNVLAPNQPEPMEVCSQVFTEPDQVFNGQNVETDAKNVIDFIPYRQREKAKRILQVSFIILF